MSTAKSSILLAALVVLSSAQHASKQRLSKGELMEIAGKFLESPDSGVWNGAGDTFENIASTLDHSGGLVARYKRYYEGLPVLGGSVKIYATPGGEVSFNIPPRPFMPPKNIVASVDETRVWDVIADDMRADRDGLFGSIMLALDQTSQGETRLVWYVRVSHRDASRMEFIIDAQTGEVLIKEKGYAEASVPFSGIGYMRPQSGSLDPTEVGLDITMHDDDGTFWLVDHTRGGTKVLDMQDKIEDKGDFYGRTYTQPSANAWGGSVWGDGLDWKLGNSTTGPTGETAAVEAMWGAQRTWDMLKNTLNLEGLDGNAERMVLRVHIREEEDKLYSDANWDGDYMNFGDGKTSDSWSRTELSTVAHEAGHGVWHYLVQDKLTKNVGEARGLNEGHGDICAALAYHYTKLAGGSGSKIPTNERGNLEWFRYRSVNPKQYKTEKDGMTVYGLEEYKFGMEYIEEHCQGAAYGHMFVILSMGMPALAEADADPCNKNPFVGGIDKSYTCLQKPHFPLGLAGIGVDSAARLWILATAKYFDEDPTFHEARGWWLQAAQDIFLNPSPEYAAVQNAFFLINVGSPAEDMFPPEVEANPPIVDNYEGSVLVEVAAVDDIGVVQIEVAVSDSKKTVPGNSFKGYLDVPWPPGNKVVTGRAWDQDLKESPILLPFDYESCNLLLKTRFETDHVTNVDVNFWTYSTNDILRTEDAAGAFLGSGYVSFYDDHWIESNAFNVPEEALQVHMGYRYHVKSDHGCLFTKCGELKVEIRDETSQLLETLTVIDHTADTANEFSNDYLKNTHTLSVPYAGQSIRIRFESSDAFSDLFRIDQVFMYYEAVPTAALLVEVDEREGSVILEPDFNGFWGALIYYVKVFVDECELLQDQYWPYHLIMPTSDFPEDTLMQAQVIAYDHFDNPIVSSNFEEFEVKSITQALINGDFEQGNAYWTLDGDVNLCIFNPASGEAYPSFLGWGCMQFLGTGSLTHTWVWIPDDAVVATMSFRFKNFNPDATCVDFKVKVIDESTGQVTDLTANLADSEAWVTHKGYGKYVVDLMPFKGTDISVVFDVVAGGNLISYLIDNVGATYTTPEAQWAGPGGFAP